MPFLFVYGTLKSPKIQKEILGKTFKSTKDTLIGFTTKTIEIDNKKYPALIPNPQKETEGLVMEVTNSDLKKIDQYETNVYTRIKIMLKSGKETYTYIENFNQK